MNILGSTVVVVVGKVVVMVVIGLAVLLLVIIGKAVVMVVVNGLAVLLVIVVRPFREVVGNELLVRAGDGAGLDVGKLSVEDVKTKGNVVDDT